jgi:hypothetical protein
MPSLAPSPEVDSHRHGAHNGRLAPLWCLGPETVPERSVVAQWPAFFARSGMDSADWNSRSPSARVVFLSNQQNSNPEEILKWQCLPMT